MRKKPFSLDPPERLKKLPPYLFVEVDRKKRELRAKGKDVIDLGVGDPDLPTPDFVIEALYEGAKDPKNHRYALDEGLPELRETFAAWFQERFHVKLDPNEEVLPLIGSKEGIAHLPLALLNPGDIALVPDPCYPVYKSATHFAGATPYLLPLLDSNDFLPDYSLIESEVLAKAKLLFLNYPNNPTSACVTKEFFKNSVSFAREQGLLIAQDGAYSEITFDGYVAPSILEIEGAKEVAIEFHSLSKTYNMTGWRIGFAVGNREVLKFLAKIKANVDSGIFQAIQFAGIQALKKGRNAYQKNVQIYQKRRDLFVRGLNRLGWDVPMPKGTFYVWIPVPPGYTSGELALKLLEDAAIVLTPGNGFGPNGEGYVRASLTNREERLEEALKRIEKIHSGKAF
ncbi:MAG: LL-diaminopimelate aminotransferase [Candidatus Omnitrophica bacterium]|nr:LL-diaminopimelate aminotransferase [Candidatus Omnitrophota bacterium]